MIAVIDYGMGNIGSILNMLRKIGAPGVAVQSPEDLLRATHVILPGVGAFDRGMEHLHERRLVDALNAATLERHTPLLGICLGMQLLCEGSEEGQAPGLGWIRGQCVRFAFPRETGLKVPHMGWNELDVTADNPLLDRGSRPRFYFVHAYHMQCAEGDNVIAIANYGSRFTAAVRRNNVFGVQFHPEKSHRFGIELFRRFVAMSV